MAFFSFKASTTEREEAEISWIFIKMINTNFRNRHLEKLKMAVFLHYFYINIIFLIIIVIVTNTVSFPLRFVVKAPEFGRSHRLICVFSAKI